MDPEQFRTWGKAMVDYVADYWETMRKREPLPRVEPGYLQKLMPTEAPENAEKWEDIFRDIEPLIMKGTTHWHHPHFFAYYPTANSYPAIVADILSDGINAIGFTWNSSPAMTELEMVVMDWLGKMLKLPDEFLYASHGTGAGMIQCTASDCTLVAVLAAKSRALLKLAEKSHTKELKSQLSASDLAIDQKTTTRLIAYTSDQAHSSVERAGLLAGIVFRLLPTDDEYALRGQTLEDAIKADLDKGLIPFCVVATLGTTPSCAFDNLPEIGPICKKYNLWLHVDAAYAGSAFICPEYRPMLNGVEFADTFNFNAHKWLQVNFDCAAMWFRDTNEVEKAFLVDPLYLKHDHQGGAVPDFRNWQVPLGRRFRALKLWFVLRAFGVHALQEHIRNMCRLATEFEALVRADERYEITAPVKLGLVTFRRKGDNKLNERIVKAINDDHRIHLVPSHLRELYMIRLSVCSTMTTSDDIRFAWNVIREVTEKVEAEH